MDADKVAEEFIYEVLQVEKADFDYASQVEKTREIRTGRICLLYTSPSPRDS